MLDSGHRDILVNNVQSAQVAALHRALDAAWAEGYAAGKKANSIRYRALLIEARQSLNADALMGDLPQRIDAVIKV